MNFSSEWLGAATLSELRYDHDILHKARKNTEIDRFSVLLRVANMAMAYWTPDSGSLSPDNVMSMYQESRLMSHPRSIKISPILASEGVMKYLWKRSQRVETTVDSLRQIASAGNYDYVVEHIRGGGSNFNNTDKNDRFPGKPAIYYALICEDKEMVQLFLNKKQGKEGEEPPRDKDGRTALHDALDSGSNAMAELCLGKELVSLPDSRGRTPLIYAARTGNTLMLQHLHGHGASIDSGDEEKGRTALHWAAHCGSEGTVKELVRRGADVTARDHDGHTALHMAAANGHFLATTLLLENKKLHHEHAAKSKLLIECTSNMEERDEEGNTLLHWAARKSNAALVEVMLRSLGERDAASLAMQNEHDQTPLHLATRDNDAAMIKVMVEHLGEKPDAILLKQDGQKRTALHLAAVERKVEATLKVETMLKCLKENTGAIMMIQDQRRNTPLHIAAEYGSVGSIKVMLECLEERAGTVMVMLGWFNRTPLHYAAATGNAAMVKMMLEYLKEEYGRVMTMQDEEPTYDFDPVGTRRGGKTPLHCAAASGNEATVVAILDYLAKTSIAGNHMDIIDHKKCTPLHLAARESKGPIIKAMLTHLKKTEGALCLTMRDNDGMLPLEYPLAHRIAQGSEFAIEMVPK
ncbi:hypothetical protein MY3296_009927 [Beauveria thailandica]